MRVLRWTISPMDVGQQAWRNRRFGNRLSLGQLLTRGGIVAR